ncbi:penicillin-binding protein [Catellatospora sp. TT07R-123]|uniref:transglycosylase domain-containing protein n=1 Tax=Catellatospora sp. TT07R-123 TaxID=2733863 RepID=UPI001B18BCA5|nr:transglycosylase domain-containing protein [Catellatospora sp. TT07R-123]GHJ46497.1 penicillin-binding protein [Catellatospora sp. TT07R-123]
MRKRDHNLLVNAASLLICGLLAGVVVAAAAFPAVALSGLATKAGSEAFGQLPDELTVKTSPQISYLYASDNKTLIATMYDENRRDLALAEIPQVMQKAIIAAEDQKFYEHNGVDVMGIARAFINNKAAGEVQQGASTLTMQFVRLSISYSANTAQEVVDATEDTTKRKVREMRYALAIEQKMGKDKILEGYLNTAYFGNRAYGVYAAASVYFGKEPKDLTASEAAFLAALVKFPGDFNVETGVGKQEAMGRRDYVLDEMVQTGALTAEEAAKGKAEELKIVGKITPNGCVQATSNAGFFCDFFQRWWNEQEQFGATTYDRERALKSGGFRIQTSFDLQTQNAMRTSINNALKGWKWKSDALMQAAIEPGTGRVRGLATNRNFKIDSKTKPQNGLASNPALASKGIRGSYPNTTNPLMTGGPDIAGYQAGSVMKLFTMVAAIEKGYPLATTINTTAPYVSHMRIDGDPNCGGFWCPNNSGNKNWGPQNMWTGFGNSVNTFFVPLFEMVGGAKVIDVAKRLGLTFYDNPNQKIDDFYHSQHPDDWGPFTLGASDQTPLQIANAFATLAADGKYCKPIPVESITNSKGEKLEIGSQTECTQNIAVDVARAAIDAARCPVGDQSLYGRCNGTTARASRDIIGKPIAGKTGTTDNSKSVTLTITTKQLAISGFFTDPDWAQVSTHKMSHDVVNPSVQNAMKGAMKGKAGIQFSKPGSNKLVTGNQVSIPVVTCKPIPEAKSILSRAGFDVDTAKQEVDSPCPKGTAAGTNPTGKTIKNGVVVIEISNGKGATPPPGGGPGGGGPGGGGPGGGGGGGNGNHNGPIIPPPANLAAQLRKQE